MLYMDKLVMENDELTFYNVEGKITCFTDSLQIYYDYETLCNDWLNTGLQEDDEAFRTSKDEERDRDEYYDYFKGVWFACW